MELWGKKMTFLLVRDLDLDGENDLSAQTHLVTKKSIVEGIQMVAWKPKIVDIAVDEITKYRSSQEFVEETHKRHDLPYTEHKQVIHLEQKQGYNMQSVDF